MTGVPAVLAISAVLAPAFLTLHILEAQLLNFCSLAFMTTVVRRLPPPDPVPRSLAARACWTTLALDFLAKLLASLTDVAITVDLVTET